MAGPVMKLGLGSVSFWCDPCDEIHSVIIGVGGWTFNTNLFKPTLAPSIIMLPLDPTKKKCHFTIEKGTIRYWPDCEHTFAGNVVLLRPLEDWPQNKLL